MMVGFVFHIRTVIIIAATIGAFIVVPPARADNCPAWIDEATLLDTSADGRYSHYSIDLRTSTTSTTPSTLTIADASSAPLATVAIEPLNFPNGNNPRGVFSFWALSGGATATLTSSSPSCNVSQAVLAPKPSYNVPTVNVYGGDSVTGLPRNGEVFGLHSKVTAGWAFKRPLSYPVKAKESGQQGVVVVEVHISSAGDLRSATVFTSSGFQLLDNEAVAAASASSFVPAVEDGRAVAADYLIDYVFMLAGYNPPVCPFFVSTARARSVGDLSSAQLVELTIGGTGTQDIPGFDLQLNLTSSGKAVTVQWTRPSNANANALPIGVLIDGAAADSAEPIGVPNSDGPASACSGPTISIRDYAGEPVVAAYSNGSSPQLSLVFPGRFSMQAKPTYPAVDMQAHESGYAELLFRLDELGKARDISVIDAIGDAAFVTSAQDALSRSTFVPLSPDHQTYYRVNYSFHARPNDAQATPPTPAPIK